MDQNKKAKRRFANPTVLTDDDNVLGLAVKDWDKAFTGNIQEKLLEVKKLAEEVQRRKAINSTSVGDSSKEQS